MAQACGWCGTASVGPCIAGHQPCWCPEKRRPLPPFADGRQRAASLILEHTPLTSRCEGCALAGHVALGEKKPLPQGIQRTRPLGKFDGRYFSSTTVRGIKV